MVALHLLLRGSIVGTYVPTKAFLDGSNFARHTFPAMTSERGNSFSGPLRLPLTPVFHIDSHSLGKEEFSRASHFDAPEHSSELPVRLARNPYWVCNSFHDGTLSSSIGSL